ncbi:MAG: DedA family protein [Ignavibacteriaceae bacterium]|nr:DedA family protein [Ignavibacteriaceae bacterium]
MLEHILHYISDAAPFWIYTALFFFAFIENVFPPSPSDLVVLVGGSLISEGAIYFIPTLFLTSIGSVLGFMTLFYLGSQLDRKVIQAGKIKFISIAALEKAERWFTKYGYFIIAANRFMPGTRSVISFFAGLSELNVKRTILLATLSSFTWNAIILYLGILFGNNLPTVDRYLSAYSNIVAAITVLVIVVFTIRYFWIKKKKPKN